MNLIRTTPPPPGIFFLFRFRNSEGNKIWKKYCLASLSLLCQWYYFFFGGGAGVPISFLWARGIFLNMICSMDRGQKINANFFCTKFFDNPSGHGRPRRKSWTSAPKNAFSCGPGGGEKLFDPWASGRKGQECPREIRTKKFICLCCFSSLTDNLRSCTMREVSKLGPQDFCNTLVLSNVLCFLGKFLGKMRQRHLWRRHLAHTDSAPHNHM